MTVLRKGGQLGPFVLDKRVAMGGMAEIWAARRQSDPSRVHALKVLLPNLARDQMLRDMFMDEVRIAERLRHPNIVQVDGVYEDGSWLFQAMELLDGKDLRRLLSACLKAGKRMPVPIAVMIATDVARALCYAHQAKSESGEALDIVHRDVSPHNVIVSKDGVVKVLDFGIARAKERLTKTTRGVIKGKAAYMAPEQALAQPLSPQTDVYALGIVLWEMLAMRRLFKGSSDAVVLAAVCEGDVPPIRLANPDVSEALSAVVMKMLSLRPTQRHASMKKVEYDLLRVLFAEFPDQDDTQAVLTAWVRPLLEPPKGTAVMPNTVLPPLNEDDATSTDTDPLPASLIDANTALKPRIPPPDAQTEAVAIAPGVEAPTEAVAVPDVPVVVGGGADPTIDDLGPQPGRGKQALNALDASTIGVSPVSSSDAADDTLQEVGAEADVARAVARVGLSREAIAEHPTELEGFHNRGPATPSETSRVTPVGPHRSEEVDAKGPTRPYSAEKRQALAPTEAVPAAPVVAARMTVESGPTEPPINRAPPSHAEVLAAAGKLQPSTDPPSAASKVPSIAPMAPRQSFALWWVLGLVVGIAVLLWVWLSTG